MILGRNSQFALLFIIIEVFALRDLEKSRSASIFLVDIVQRQGINRIISGLNNLDNSSISDIFQISNLIRPRPLLRLGMVSRTIQG